MRTRLSGIALAGLIAALGVATACGGDDGGKSSASTKDKGGAGKSGGATAGQVPCGPTICKPEAGFMGQMCCRSNFEGTCGQMVAGTCTELPPKSDPKCEPTSFSVMGNMVQVPSCCTTNDECGLVFNAGFGAPMCTSLVQASQFGGRFGGGNMMFMFTGMLPTPKKCSTGEPIEVPAMGGAGSGG